MQLTLTTSPVATRDGEHIIIPVQDDVALRLTVHEAMRLGQSACREASKAVIEARYIEPTECEIVAFPARRTA